MLHKFHKRRLKMPVMLPAVCNRWPSTFVIVGVKLSWQPECHSEIELTLVCQSLLKQLHPFDELEKRMSWTGTTMHSRITERPTFLIFNHHLAQQYCEEWTPE